MGVGGALGSPGSGVGHLLSAIWYTVRFFSMLGTGAGCCSYSVGKGGGCGPGAPRGAGRSARPGGVAGGGVAGGGVAPWACASASGAVRGRGGEGSGWGPSRQSCAHSPLFFFQGETSPGERQ